MEAWLEASVEAWLEVLVFFVALLGFALALGLEHCTCCHRCCLTIPSQVDVGRHERLQLLSPIWYGTAPRRLHQCIPAPKLSSSQAPFDFYGPSSSALSLESTEERGLD